MSTFVIVPGITSGGWYLGQVATLLGAAGHVVFRPTLTGLGERAHLLSPAIDLATHIQDVWGVLEYEDLQAVILVGHSYGGMVITGVAERLPHRLIHLVYLDALVPADGEAAVDLMAPAAVSQLEQMVQQDGAGWRLPADSRTGSADPRRTDHPWKTMTQPFAITRPEAARLARTYISCTADKAPGTFMHAIFATSAARARAAGWHFVELDATHSVIRTAPNQLVAVLLSLV